MCDGEKKHSYSMKSGDAGLKLKTITLPRYHKDGEEYTVENLNGGHNIHITTGLEPKCSIVCDPEFLPVTGNLAISGGQIIVTLDQTGEV